MGYTKKEIGFIESELKDWFLTRRFGMERNIALKKALDEKNFTGLAMANPDVPDAQKVLWSDLVQGKPELEDSLSNNAKAMKADMYTKTFKAATDLDHPCRLLAAHTCGVFRTTTKISPSLGKCCAHPFSRLSM